MLFRSITPIKPIGIFYIMIVHETELLNTAMKRFLQMKETEAKKPEAEMEKNHNDQLNPIDLSLVNHDDTDLNISPPVNLRLDKPILEANYIKSRTSIKNITLAMLSKIQEDPLEDQIVINFERKGSPKLRSSNVEIFDNSLIKRNILNSPSRHSKHTGIKPTIEKIRKKVSEESLLHVIIK